MTTITRRLAAVFCAAGLGLAGQGCATVAAGGGGDQKIKITTNPPGAVVVVDGQPQGASPASIPLSRTTEHRVEISAAGYETAHVTIRRNLNPWLLGNVLVGGFIGLAVDIVSDSTHTLTPNELDVTLTPVAPLPPGTPVGTPAPK